MKTKEIVSAALFITLSFIGANIKIMGSIAFDSMPGFLGALLLGPVYGAFIGMIGHFLTALLSGFPLSFPVHIVIMIDMAATMVIFSLVYRKVAEEEDFSLKAITLAGVLGVIMNGPVSLLMLTPLLLPAIGLAGMITLLPVVSGVAALNIVLACLVYKLLPNRIKKVRKKI
ncbi:MULTISPECIES: ECF transporter S component [Pelosinus]|uniref:ECF transporter, substrate-specific component n=1 Tax=Pelosinus fermentans B4 TaxID=1149862 RepID=I9AWV0_9FIRM|nr:MULTISPECIES: ECF transporter S component [Pelosinus]EIW17347.1 ECF transporter, substrate-specific component [Pelosinus fermentans B4]EIW23406.1 protein of unknown function DUF1393 [Pelosinus fermentans A11]OAM96517.1 ECF transporter, substrate-specific component [Pelosinus fermentans DSM 17108]SDR40958.1 Protein of unknown function [Pelosinus fermentans]